MTFIQNHGAKLLNVTFVAAMLMPVAWAQVGPEIRITREQTGLVVTGPASSQHFQMRITGADAGRLQTTKKYWFRANGIRFEFFSEENSKFFVTDIPYAMDDRAVLKLYRAGFSHYNPNIKVRSLWVKLENGQTALFWSYDKFVASTNGSSPKGREMFLIVAGPGNVFGLFAPVPPDRSEQETRRLLIQVLGTLTFSEKNEE